MLQNMASRLRHGIGFLVVFLLVVAGLSFFVCFHMLGLMLDLSGALILVVPVIPTVRDVLYRIPFGPFRTAARIENKVGKVWDDEAVEVTRDYDPEFGDIEDVVMRHEDKFDKLKLTPHAAADDDNDVSRREYATVVASPSTAITSDNIIWGKEEIASILRRAAERRLTVAGAILLAIGFLFQMAAILLPPIRSPMANFFIFC